MVSRKMFREVYRLPQRINWYAGHLTRGLRELQKKMCDVDCIVEMHDARIPISGRNIQFYDSLTSNFIPHILLLNKCDLTDTCDHGQIASQVEQKDSLQHAIFTSCTSNKYAANDCLLPYLRALAVKSQQKRFHVMVFGIPNVGKRTLIDRFKEQSMPKKGRPDTHIKISEFPDIYLASEPGLLQPRILNDEMGLRLALLGCIPEEKVGIDIIADYLLFWMNKNHHFHYVNKLGCVGRTDNMQNVLASLAEKERLYREIKHQNGGSVLVPDLERATRRFVELFRTGELGAINLDIPHK